MMKKLVIFYSFVITTFMVVSGILSATNYVELTTAVLFSPLALYFFLLVFPKSSKTIPTIDIAKPIVEAVPEVLKKVKNPDYDPERRKFLKLIGAAGGSLFLMTIFTRSAEASFFGSMPGPGTLSLKNTSGVKIDPAEKKPTDGYNITEIDDTGADTYYGFVNKDGNWYIQKETSSGAYRYVKGNSDFSTNWTNKTSLSYDYFNNVF